jgi:hypothetical protein
MPKEPYLKPEVKSEKVEPGALAGSGSPGGGPLPYLKPVFGICCPG